MILYIGPGLGIGTIIIVIIVLLIVLASFFSIFGIYIKNFWKKVKGIFKK